MTLHADLVSRVWTPLLVGGRLEPVAPLGERRARELARTARLADYPMEELQAARLRHALRLWPVTHLPPPPSADWFLLCALNDLLQSTNPSLSGVFGSSRPKRLLEMTKSVIELAGIPHTPCDALARYASFPALLDIRRMDTKLAWWTGHARFVGRLPPRRLSAWPRLRRVRRNERWVSLMRMAEGIDCQSAYESCVAMLLRASPLTILATPDPGPLGTGELAWHPSCVQLLSCAMGRSLVFRAFQVAGQTPSIEAIHLAPLDDEQRRQLVSFIDSVQALGL